MVARMSAMVATSPSEAPNMAVVVVSDIFFTEPDPIGSRSQSTRNWGEAVDSADSWHDVTRDEMHVVKILHIEHLQIETRQSEPAPHLDLLDNLSGRSGNPVCLELVDLSTDVGRPSSHFGVIGATADDLGDGSKERLRVTPDRAAGVVNEVELSFGYVVGREGNVEFICELGRESRGALGSVSTHDEWRTRRLDG